MAESGPPTPRRFPALLRQRAASFGHALRGVGAALRTEVHLWFHAAATVAVVALGLYCGLARWEWVAVVLSVGAVWCAELVNTAVEAVVDLVSPQYHPLAGRAKDVAAGAVLVMALAAAVVGVVVFGPRLWGQ
ncbi:diacylglycerol kinase family protein [Hymenobacter rubripertinctus]|uniref:diacylglycerol kinase family protein n=1 Tax=Hymenobacter rubripertinctus TaxID=2029981 RepID=UPI001FEAC0C3|nr:diacylglycerol kinase family protein [Hymenobacter rubripertinctus]